MIKLLPYISTPKFGNRNTGRLNNYSPSFFAAESLQASKYPNLTAVKSDEIQIIQQWLKDPTILMALNKLKDIDFDEKDIKYLHSQGVILPFLSGKEAVDFIYKSNTRMKFSPLSSPHIHAQYDFDNNFIKINEIYKDTQNPAEIMAIAGAILHEAGHAKDKDGMSSVQEEINCLALNALAHRAFSRKFPNDFVNSDALIIKDGTRLYSDLFFDADSTKSKLIARLKEKYGFLQSGDLNHPPSSLAIKVKTVSF